VASSGNERETGEYGLSTLQMYHGSCWMLDVHICGEPPKVVAQIGNRVLNRETEACDSPVALQPA
jgi:hypothetical protein